MGDSAEHLNNSWRPAGASDDQWASISRKCYDGELENGPPIVSDAILGAKVGAVHAGFITGAAVLAGGMFDPPIAIAIGVWDGILVGGGAIIGGIVGAVRGGSVEKAANDCIAKELKEGPSS
jgi:hypothetical protein